MVAEFGVLGFILLMIIGKKGIKALTNLVEDVKETK